MSPVAQGSARPAGHDDDDRILINEVLVEEERVERRLVAKIYRDVAIAVPIAILCCAAIITLAVMDQHPNWIAWEGLAVFVGGLVGAFFGVWAAFVSSAPALDDVDRHAWKVTESDGDEGARRND
jgi:hypothetical protein